MCSRDIRISLMCSSSQFADSRCLGCFDLASTTFMAHLKEMTMMPKPKVVNLLGFQSHPNQNLLVTMRVLLMRSVLVWLETAVHQIRGSCWNVANKTLDELCNNDKGICLYYIHGYTIISSKIRNSLWSANILKQKHSCNSCSVNEVSSNFDQICNSQMEIWVCVLEFQGWPNNSYIDDFVLWRFSSMYAIKLESSSGQVQLSIIGLYWILYYTYQLMQR